MRVYEVWADEYDYDDFMGLVVVAENKDKALDIVKSGYFGRCYFKERQGKIHIEEVDLTTEGVVLESFKGA